MSDIAIDMRSLLATVFLATSLYLFYGTSVSLYNAMIALVLTGAVAFGLYLSYRLIVIINSTLS